MAENFELTKTESSEQGVHRRKRLVRPIGLRTKNFAVARKPPSGSNFAE